MAAMHPRIAGAQHGADTGRSDPNGAQTQSTGESFVTGDFSSQGPISQHANTPEAVLRHVADGIVVKDVHNRITWVNPAAVELFGMPAEEMLGTRPDDPSFDTRHLDGRPFAPEDLPSTRALATGQPVRGVVLDMARADGARVQVEMNVHPLHAGDGSLYGVVSAIRDVGSRLQAEADARLNSALLGAVGQALIATDPQGHIIYWSRGAHELYGWSTGEAIGRNIVDLTPAQQSREQAEQVMTALSEGQSWTGDFLVRRRDGEVFTALVTNTPLLGDDGALRAIIGVSIDISDRKANEESMALFTAIVESSSDAIYSATPQGLIESWNPAAARLFGYARQEIIGKPVTLLAPRSRHDEVSANLATAVSGKSRQNIHVVRRHRGGDDLNVALSFSPVRDSDGDIVAVATSARDITEQLELHERLEHQALHDPLTGLPNRVLLDDRLRQALARAERDAGHVAVIFLDLDAFKTINDATGHRQGDIVLTEVAQRLSTIVGPADTLARFGGDEFVMVCEDTGLEEAKNVARRCLEAFDAPFYLDGRPHHVSASVGIACSPPNDPDTLLAHADAAMYDAKRRGRARSSVFSAMLAAGATEQLELSSDLHQALQSDDLELHYQPVVDLATGHLVGVEALARWHHLRHGHVPPSTFVRVAEEAGLVAELDSWAIRHAARDIRRMVDAGLLGPTGRVAVNNSALKIADADIEEVIKQAFGNAGVPYTRLSLEVTETAVMTDPDNAVATLNRLRELGVRVKIDDFGVGHSSLNYLKHLPVDGVKIDRCFVGDMIDNEDGLAIVIAIIELTRALRLPSIAEGIETLDQHAKLRQLGCSAGQGYLWSPAVPLEELIETAAAAGTGPWPFAKALPGAAE